MRRKLFALIFVGCLAVILSVAVNAEPDGPKITEPYQYSEHKIGGSVTIKWNPPNSYYGTVSYYRISIRGFTLKDDVTASNTGGVVVSPTTFSASTNSITLSGSNLLNWRNNYGYEKYKISVGAVMTDGTPRWSDYQYFYIASNNTPVNRPISFRIYNGFTSDSKNQVYYSCQNWNNKLNLEYEVINTYPYTSGTNITYSAKDGINAVTKGVTEKEEWIMSTTAWFSSDYRTQEVDIIVSKNHPWANSNGANTYNFYNVMMHEMGHAVGLNDKYDSWATEWTMYGYSDYNEDKKITLTLRDIVNGISLYD